MNARIYRNVFILAVSVVFCTSSFAKKHMSTGAVPKVAPKAGMDFIENKGQWVAEARFKADVPGGAMFITNKGFVYNYVSNADLERVHELSHKEGIDISNEIIHHHAYKVKFEHANTDITYETSGKQNYYQNYILGNDKSKWASNAGLFNKVIQKNVYNGIDVAIYSKDGSYKYDFIVAPQADLNQISLAFEGVSPEITAEGNLKVKTSVNEVIEQAPYSYQIIDGKEIMVKSAYRLQKGKLTFVFPEGYNKNYPLVIDPTLVFATYSGGTSAANYSLATTYDSDGNLYAGAYAYGSGWPVTVGAFQSTWSAAVDVAVNKYSALGNNLIFSTFYGGSGTDLAHAMIVNEQDELIIAGSTTSGNLPTSTGCYDNSLSGSTDIFVAHFNSLGTNLIGATYIGGTGVDPTAFSLTVGGVNFNLQTQNTISPVEVNFDNAGNIWVVGSTPSTDFPVTANASQSTSSGGYEGIIFKLNPACSQLLYSSYMGGSGADCISAIQFNSSGNVVVCGTTLSTNFPTTTGVLHATSQGGFSDGFVSIINATTGAVLQSTYVGTDNTDRAVNIQVDGNDNIYVLGQTLGAYPISTGVYAMAGADVFIDKLSPALATSLLSTRVGTPQSVTARYFPTAFVHDICDNIYVAGLGGAGGSELLPNSMPLSPDAFSTTPDNFYFVVLTPNFGALLFGSYYGSTNDDHTHCGVNRLDPEGRVYHSVCSGASNFPTTANVFAPNKINTGQDIISFKFDFEATGVQSDFELDATINGNDSGCIPYTVKMANTSSVADEYTWNFGDGSPISTQANPTHTYTVPGTYTITLYANNDSACITSDTAYMTITVMQTELPDLVVNDTTLCFLQQINIGVQINNPSVNNTISWGPAGGILSPPNQAVITVNPSINNVYYVTVKDTIPGICGFSASDTVHIDLSPRGLDIITNDTVVCEGTIIPIVAVGTTGYSYNWYPSLGVSDTTALQPNITITQPTNIYTLTASYPNCQDTSVIITIDMHYIPHLELGPNKNVCQWTEVPLESVVSPFRNDYIYQWTPATPNLNNPTAPNADFISDTTITYRLNVQTPIGCSADDSIKVTVYPGAFGAISSDTGYCPNNKAQLWASGGVSYAWTPSYGLNDTTISNPIAAPLTSTDYTVYIKNTHNCLDTEFVSVQVYAQAVLALPDTVHIYPGEQYHVEPETNCLYFQWFPPSGLSNANIADPLMSPLVRTRYFVTATTEHGCTVTDSMDVRVEETVIDMPNAFTPSSANNLFKPSKRGIAQLKNFAVYNRWGNKVFNTTNIDEGWDGTFNGQSQPLGVYVYVIEAVSDNGKVFTKQGNVTLIR